MTIPNYVPLHIHCYLLSAVAAPASALPSGRKNQQVPVGTHSYSAIRAEEISRLLCFSALHVTLPRNQYDYLTFYFKLDFDSLI